MPDDIPMSETRLFAGEQKCLHRTGPTSLCCVMPYGHSGQHQYPGVQSLSTHRDEEGALRTPDGARVYEPPEPQHDVYCHGCGETVSREIAYRDGPNPFHWNRAGGGHAMDAAAYREKKLCGDETGDGSWACNKSLGHPGLHGQKRGEGGGFAATWGDDHVAGGKPTLCMNKSGRYLCRKPKGHEGSCSDLAPVWATSWFAAPDLSACEECASDAVTISKSTGRTVDEVYQEFLVSRHSDNQEESVRCYCDSTCSCFSHGIHDHHDPADCGKEFTTFTPPGVHPEENPVTLINKTLSEPYLLAEFAKLPLSVRLRVYADGIEEALAAALTKWPVSGTSFHDHAQTLRGWADKWEAEYAKAAEQEKVAEELAESLFEAGWKKVTRDHVQALIDAGWTKS